MKKKTKKRARRKRHVFRNPGGKRRRAISLSQAIVLVNERFAAGGLRVEERALDDGLRSVNIKLGYRELELQIDLHGNISVMVDSSVVTLLTWEESEETLQRLGGRLVVRR